MRRWLALLLAPWLLGGCGMYGALYLEEDTRLEPDAPPVAAPEAPAGDAPGDDSPGEDPREDDAEGREGGDPPRDKP